MNTDTILIRIHNTEFNVYKYHTKSFINAWHMCSRTVLQLHTYNNGKVYVTIEYLGITASHFC